MSTITNDYSNSSSKRVATTQQILPDSPDYAEKYSMNAEDLQMTSNLDSPFDYQQRKPRRSYHHQNLVVVGSHQTPITLGRGGACTVKIGRRNRNISRVHVSIAFNGDKEQFELTVLGLNGACVDNIQYDQHAVIPLENESLVDVLGDHFRFKIPPPPSSLNFMKRLQKHQEIENLQVTNKNSNSVFRELSPEAEETQQPETSVEAEVENEPEVEIEADVEDKVEEQMMEEEETYPAELVPEDALSPIEKESSPEQEEINNVLQDNNGSDSQDYAEVIIDALVFSRTSSMPISDIYTRILKANPTYAKQSREIWIERIQSVLHEKPFFGEIQRKGKTADGSPVENLYYYNSDLDPVEWRRATYTQVGRSARKCTLKDKQYFWKIPPKLGRHRSSYIPPLASDLKKQKSKSFQDENVDPKKLKF